MTVLLSAPGGGWAAVPDRPTETVQALVDGGRAHRLAGRFPQAQAALEKARLEAGRAGDAAGSGAALNELGRLRHLQSDFDGARALHEEALATCEAAGERRCETAAILGLGSVFVAKGDTARVGEHARRALALAEDLGDGALASTALNHLGWVEQDHGNYEGAADLYQQALGAADRSGDTAAIAAILGSFGRLHRMRGETDVSLDYLRRSVVLLEGIGDKPGIASAANHMGIAHSLRGEYAEAMRRFQQGLDVAEALGQQRDIGHGLNNIGIVHRRQGDFDLALDYFRRSLKVREELGDKLGMAGSNNNIALAYMSRGDHALAHEHYERALALARERGSKDETAGALSNMGVNHRLQGDYAPALERYAEALKIREELGDKGGVGNVSRSIAIVYSLQGRHSAALEQAERAIALARETGLKEVLVDALSTAGASQLALGRPVRARELLEEAIAVVEELRRSVAGAESPQQHLLEIHITPYLRMVDLLFAQGDAEAALGYAERAKGRVLLDVLHSGRTVVKRMTEAERERERRLTSALVLLNGQLTREERRARPDKARVDALKAQVDAARRERDDFEARLYAAHPDLRVDRGDPPAFRLDQAATLVPDAETVLVEYAVTESGTYVFVVDRPGSHAAPRVRARHIPVARKALRERVRDVRTRMAARDLDFRPAARRLYDVVLQPVRAELRGKRRVVVVPDDALWDVPLQALVTPAGRYVVEEHAVAYAPSLTVLREMARRRSPPEDRPRLLAFGNPDLSAQADGAPSATRDARLLPLPEAEREVRKLAELYGLERSTVLVGADAHEGQFKAQAGRFGVVHLATHGVLDSASPMHSRLMLAAGGSKEDGLLEAWELLNLDLRADLVVLSACETGRGRVTAGEGVIGLSWAMFVAGSPTVVVSQWKVDSASTSDLMLEFHRELRSDARPSRAAALRAAALKLLRTRFAHPFYWAGFIVVGDAS